MNAVSNAERSLVTQPVILAIDPGSEKSAWLVLYEGVPVPGRFGIDDNAALVEVLELRLDVGPVVIEQIESYGMPVGREVFETVWWSGRFAQAVGGNVVRLPRRAVKLALCHDSRAKDANVRQALIDRFGGKDAAIGSKARPGPLYGVTKDVWAALAVAVTYADAL